MDTPNIKLNVLKDFKSGFTTKELINKYGYLKTARPTEHAVIGSFFSRFKEEEIYK